MCRRNEKPAHETCGQASLILSAAAGACVHGGGEIVGRCLSHVRDLNGLHAVIRHAAEDVAGVRVVMRMPRVDQQSAVAPPAPEITGTSLTTVVKPAAA